MKPSLRVKLAVSNILPVLLLGPSVFNVFGRPYFEAAHTTDTLHELGELGVIFLMFTAGLEIHLYAYVRGRSYDDSS